MQQEIMSLIIQFLSRNHQAEVKETPTAREMSYVGRKNLNR